MDRVRRHAVLVVCTIVALTFVSRRADAYAWMIRHDYGGCNQCHADPSGGGLLTAYGRAQGDLLLRSRYGDKVEDEEVGRSAGFLLGAFELPDALLLGGDLRVLRMWTKAAEAPVRSAFVWMQSDVQGQVTVGRFRANASAGYAQQGALPAAVTHGQTDNVVSRVHWIGADLGSDQNWTLRGGRMNLPFGVRFVEHTLAVRQATRTNVNDQQQHGISIAYNGSLLRGEVMAVLGNYQLRPDMYRSRGVVGYAEAVVVERLAVGISGLVLHSERDLELSVPVWRHAYGVTARHSPTARLVLLGEVDLLYRSQPGGVHDTGYTGVVQADWEILQGLHLALTAEAMNATPRTTAATCAAWGTANWFFAPHLDARIDLIAQRLAVGSAYTSATSIIAQLHAFL